MKCPNCEERFELEDYTDNTPFYPRSHVVRGNVESFACVAFPRRAWERDAVVLDAEECE